MSEIQYYLSVEGEDERELTRAEALSFWLRPDDPRWWRLSVRVQNAAEAFQVVS